MADAMKLVPYEPTEAMLDAVADWPICWPAYGEATAPQQAAFHADRATSASTYRAMLAASPPAREEAPAEGADQMRDLVWSWLRTDEAKRIAIRFNWGDAMSLGNYLAEALRNRTSEPEAGAVAWRIERTDYAVKFWVGVQGFTVATKDGDPDGDEHLSLMEKMLRRALIRITHPASATADKLRDGYVSAFYEIAAMLGISARPSSPASVWLQEMKPALQRLISASGAK